MDRVIALCAKAAKSTIPVLIEGETGVGKELVARVIQGTGDRAGKPFITVNCGAIPANLVESTLFGHKKGAFTGAIADHAGKFAEAHGGTLFLDEVGELPLDAQVKLLRAIQEGEIEPVGSAKIERVNVRVISATNRRLLNLAKSGEFREDLYYRLNVFPIYVPPLRERPEDIPALVNHFIARFAAEAGKRVVGISGLRWNCLRATTGPATSASSKTRSIAPSCCATAPTSRPPISPRSSRRRRAAADALRLTEALPALQPRFISTRLSVVCERRNPSEAVPDRFLDRQRRSGAAVPISNAS